MTILKNKGTRLFNKNENNTVHIFYLTPHSYVGDPTNIDNYTFYHFKIELIIRKMY